MLAQSVINLYGFVREALEISQIISVYCKRKEHLEKQTMIYQKTIISE